MSIPPCDRIPPYRMSANLNTGDPTATTELVLRARSGSHVEASAWPQPQPQDAWHECGALNPACPAHAAVRDVSSGSNNFTENHCNGVLPCGGSSGTASILSLSSSAGRLVSQIPGAPCSRMPHTARYILCCSCPSLEHTHAKDHPHCSSLALVHSHACYTWTAPPMGNRE